MRSVRPKKGDCNSKVRSTGRLYQLSLCGKSCFTLNLTFLPPRCILLQTVKLVRNRGQGRSDLWRYSMPPPEPAGVMQAIPRLAGLAKRTYNASMEVSQEYVSAGCNRVVGALHWGGNQLVTYAAHNLVILYDAEVNTASGTRTRSSTTFRTSRVAIACSKKPLRHAIPTATFILQHSSL